MAYSGIELSASDLDVGNLLRYSCGEDDGFASRALEEALASFSGTKREALARAAFDADGIEYQSVYQPLDFFDGVEELRVRFLEPDIKRKWDFNRPTMDLLLKPGGRARSRSFKYDPQRSDNWEKPAPLEVEEAMYALFVTQGYAPKTLSEASDRLHEIGFGFVSPAYDIDGLWKAVRAGKVIPFEVRVCVYTRVDRRMYDLDLVRNRLLADFRNGKVQPGATTMPAPVHCMFFDRIHASLDIPPLNKKIFTLLFHSDGITPQEVGVVLGISTPMATNHLKGLEERGLAKSSGRNGQLFTANLAEYERIAERLTPS